MPWKFNPFTGNLDYTDPAVVPAGSDTQVQFNDGGTFGADTGLTFDKNTKALGVSGPVILKSPNNTLYRLDVTDAGVLQVSSI